MEENQDGWSTFLDIMGKRPGLGLKILAQATAEASVETLSELGEAVVTVGVVFPLIAIGKAARAVRGGKDAIEGYGIRQFKKLVPEANEDIERANRENHLDMMALGEWGSGLRTPSLNKAVDDLYK